LLIAHDAAKPGRRKMRADALRKRKKKLLELVGRIVGTDTRTGKLNEKNDTVLIVGDWPLQKASSGFGIAGPVKVLLALLKRYAIVFFVQEFHTSSACAHCGTLYNMASRMVQTFVNVRSTRVPAGKNEKPSSDDDNNDDVSSTHDTVMSQASSSCETAAAQVEESRYQKIVDARDAFDGELDIAPWTFLPPRLRAFAFAQYRRRCKKRGDDDPLTDQQRRLHQERLQFEQEARLRARGIDVSHSSDLFKAKLTVRNDTLVCTVCGVKTDRDYTGACGILNIGLHQLRAKQPPVFTRPPYLAYELHHQHEPRPAHPFPEATAAWKAEQKRRILRGQNAQDSLLRFLRSCQRRCGLSVPPPFPVPPPLGAHLLLQFASRQVGLVADRDQQ